MPPAGLCPADTIVDHHQQQVPALPRHAGRHTIGIAAARAADIVWDTSGSANCWTGYRFVSSVPKAQPDC